jgi:16S rRNA (cytidine1402-2'-O)-methyltransferase
MPGILYVVATPIGNLEDVTLRALRILREVSAIAAEDTRRTSRLLQHYSITTRTTSLHEHNEREKTPKLVERLLAGDSIALVSDAGTPVISDPGTTLVAAARAAGVKVESVPGPSAVMAALSVAGLAVTQFTFLGFAPHRSIDLIKWANDLLTERRLVVFFEAPHRIQPTLAALAQAYGPDHVIAVGRELTKTFDELVVRPIDALREKFVDPKGEFTILVPPRDIGRTTQIDELDVETLRREVDDLVRNSPITRRRAIRAVAEKHGIRTNDLYSALKRNSTADS